MPYNKTLFLCVLAHLIFAHSFSQKITTTPKKSIKSIQELQFDIQKRANDPSIIDILYDAMKDINGQPLFHAYCGCGENGYLISCSNENTLTTFDKTGNIIQIAYYGSPEYDKNDCSKVIRIPIAKTVLYKDILKEQKEREEEYKKRFTIKTDSSYDEKTKLKLIRETKEFRDEQGTYQWHLGSTTRNYYDLNGKLIARVNDPNLKESTDPDSTKYVYDNRDRLIRDTVFWNNFPNSTTIYKYDDKNAVREEVEFEFNAKRWRKTSIQKFQNNKLMEASKFNEENGELKEKRKCVYGSKGEILEDYYYDPQGWPLWPYDKTSNEVVKEIKKTFIYQYDAHGNWVQRTVLVNGIPYHLTKRKIEYF